MHINQLQMIPTTGRHADQVRADFFYSRIIEKNEEDFQEISPLNQFNNKVRELIREQKEQITDDLEGFGEPVSTLAQDVLFPDERIDVGVRGPHGPSGHTTTVKYTGEKTDNPVLLLIVQSRDRRRRPPREPSDKLRVCIIAKNKDESESFLGFIKDEINEISTYVGDYAEVEELRSGGEIVHTYFNRQVESDSNIEDWYEDIESDPFNEAVYETVQGLTGVSLSNVRIEVDVGDNPDFDVVSLPLGDVGVKYAIEVKDFSQEHNDDVEGNPADNLESGELRSELIRKPKDYAEQADLNLISIAKGLSDDQYENLSRLADSSNVYLLNEENYEEKLSEILFENSFREVTEYIV